MTLGSSSKLMALDSSLVMESRRPGKLIGLTPAFTRARVSSSKHSYMFLLKTVVAWTASGLST